MMNSLLCVVDASVSMRLTMALLHFLWQGCCGGIVAIIGGLLLQRMSANLKYLFYSAVMFLMAVCLPVTFAVLHPRDVVIQKAKDEQKAIETSSTSQLHEASRLPSRHPDNESRGIAEITSSSADRIDASARSIPDQIAKSRLPESNATDSPPILPATTVAMFQSLSRWIALLYVTGVVVLMGRLFHGVRGAQRLRRSANTVQDEVLLKTIGKLARDMGLKTAPLVAWCDRMTIPVVIGFVKPMILLPISIASGLTQNQLEALILHELAHIRRFDPIVNLAQRVIEAILFFHPAIWFISRRISQERENAADDMVIACGWDRPLYVDALVRAAELSSKISGSRTTNQSVLLAATGTHPSEFKLRVLRLLNESPQPELQISRAGILFMVFVISFAGVIAWMQPRTSDVLIHQINQEKNVANKEQIAAEVSIEETKQSETQIAQAAQLTPDVEKAADNTLPVLDEKSALKQLEELGGVVGRDETLPDRPIVRIAFKSQSRFGDKHVHLLKSFPNLHELNMFRSLCTDESMHVVKELVGLTDLDPRMYMLTDEGLKGIGHLKNLELLRLAASKHITDACLIDIAELSNLKTLNLASCDQFTEVGFKEIKKLKSLTTLFVSIKPPHDVILNDLSNLEHLTHLSLNQSNVSEESLKAVAKLKNLTILQLVDCEITDTGLQHLKALEKLSSLFLQSSNIDNDGINELREIKSLRQLNLNNCRNVTSTGWIALADLIGLTQLSIGRTLITDAELRKIGQLKNLTDLDLHDTEISDVGIAVLRGLTNLKKLNLSETAFTEAAVKRLHDALPNTEIIATSPRPKRAPRTSLKTEESADEATAIESLSQLGGVVTRGGSVLVHPVIAVSFQPNSPFDDNDIPILRSFKRLTKLNLGQSLVTDIGMKEVSTLKNLRELNLEGARITDAGLQEISNLSNLTRLDAPLAKISDAGIQKIAELQDLTDLNLAGTKITDSGLKEIGKLKNLISLNLKSCKNISNDGLQELTELKKLTMLTLSLCKQVSDPGVRNFKLLPQLETIDLWATDVGDEGIKDLCQIKTLRSITIGVDQNGRQLITDSALKDLSGLEDLRELILSGRLITDTGVKELSRLKNLTRFVLWAQKVTDEGVAAIGEMKSLKSLDLQTTQIAAAGTKIISQLDNLEFLQLGGPEINDAAVKELAAFKNLKSMHVFGINFGDEGVKELRHLKSVTRLNVASPKVTDEGVRDFGQMPWLTSLDLSGCPKVTDECLAELRKTLPKTGISSPRRRVGRRGIE